MALNSGSLSGPVDAILSRLSINFALAWHFGTGRCHSIALEGKLCTNIACSFPDPRSTIAFGSLLVLGVYAASAAKVFHHILPRACDISPCVRHLLGLRGRRLASSRGTEARGATAYEGINKVIVCLRGALDPCVHNATLSGLTQIFHRVLREVWHFEGVWPIAQLCS